MLNQFDQDWIDEVMARNDLVDVVSQYVRLKPSGKNYIGLCLFHKEKTPSMHVSSDKQLFHCFGCKEGGNVISFLMAAERLTFVEAVKQLAERAGMRLLDASLSDEAKASEKKAKDTKDRILKVNLEAAKFFRTNLMSSAGKHASDYLNTRGIDQKTIQSFGLGYALEGWENLKDVLLKAGYEEDFLLGAGLLAESSNKTYDRFRNRVIFPIIDVKGSIVGFGGRAMDDSNPKYLNSSETLVFNKGKMLYGLNRLAKLRPLKNIILTEGYMDVISLNQYGFENTVASLGTSLTDEQAKLLFRSANQILIAYDGDNAGKKATLKAFEVFERIGCDARAVALKEGLDPDEALGKHGKDFFQSCLDSSLTSTGFKLWQLIDECDMKTKNGVSEYAKRSCEILKNEKDLIERDYQIKSTAQRTGISVALIRQEVERQMAQGVSREKGRIETKSGFHIGHGEKALRLASSRRTLLAGYTKAERHLAGLMAQNDLLAQKISAKLAGYVFNDSINGIIAETVNMMLIEGKIVNPAQVINRVEEHEIRRQMVEIMNVDIEYDDMDKFINDCAAELSRYSEMEKRRKSQEELNRMEKEGSLDTDAYLQYLRGIDASNRRIKLKGQKDKRNV